MKSNSKTKLYFIIPSIIFLLAVLYLHYSTLTISKAITTEAEVIAVFMKTLSEQDVLIALIKSFRYVLSQIILPMFPFLVLVSSGFFILFFFREKIEFKFFFAAQALFLVIVALLTNFSIAMLLTWVGILIASLFSFKTFEVRKTNFSTASSLVSSNLRWVNIFLAVGLFLALYTNFQSYESLMIRTNTNLITGFIPNMESLRSIQSQFVNQTVDGLKQSMETQYQQLPPEAKGQCGAVYDAMIVGLDNYKEQIAEQVAQQTEGQEGAGQIESLVESLPVMGQFIKATPLILAIALLSLLEFVKLFVAFGFGVAYSLAKRFT